MRVCFGILLATLMLHEARAQFSPLLSFPPKREFRGLWIATVGNIDWPTSPGLPTQTQKDQLIAILDKVVAAGFNAVVFQIRPECDALYQSSLEPWSYWLTGTQGQAPNPFYDPLQFAVDEAHKRGLELHAWFNPYRAVHGSYASAYTRAPNHVSVLHPDWILTGISSSPTTKILDPGKQVVRNYVSGVIADVVRRYDIDAAHIDDYFYVEGITTQDANTFFTESRGFSNLSDWRRDNVNLLIKQIYDSTLAVKPWVKWGVSPRGIWRNGVPPGTSGNDNYSTIYCDAVAWLQARSLDYIAPQLYWRFGGNQDYGLLQPWWSSQRNGRHFYPGLATYRIGDVAFGQATEIARQLRFNRTTGDAQGAIQFTANNITGNRGGITDSLQQDLFRFPALLPVMNWKDSIAPYPPRDIRYARLPNSGPAAIQWDLPLPGPGDTASRYAVYRFDHSPNLPVELDSSKNLLTIEGRRYSIPRIPATIPGGYYYYVATALDRNYNEGVWSSTITVTPTLPPILAFPPNGAVNQPSTLNVGWGASPLASSYHLQLGTDSLFSTVVVNDSSVADTFKIVAGLSGQVAYYWRVRARNAGGTSAFSGVSNFRTGFPVVPALVSPANFATDVSLTPSLVWNQGAGALSYRVQLATSFDFASIVKDSSGLVDSSFAVGQLQLATIYFWRVNAANALGTSPWSEIWRFRTILTSVEQIAGLPTEYGLTQNYPNPFNSITSILFSLPEHAKASLRVYDLLGREVATLIDDTLSPGEYRARFDASNLSSGVYFYRLTAGSYVAIKKMSLLK